VQATAAVIGSSKLDKSVLIGTCPNPAVAKSLTDTDWDPCKSVHPGRQQLLLSGPAARQVSIDWDLAPNPSPAVAKSLKDTGLGPVYTVHPTATAAVIRDQQQAQVSIDWDLAPTRAPGEIPNRILIGTHV
jgi:hypothetical protein